jgi:cell division protein FtsB
MEKEMLDRLKEKYLTNNDCKKVTVDQPDLAALEREVRELSRKNRELKIEIQRLKKSSRRTVKPVNRNPFK